MGCSDKESTIVSPAPNAPKNPQESAVAVTTGLTPPPVAASVPPPSDAAKAAVPTARNAGEVIVQGSKNDPNVVPDGFVPKPPALQYTVNGEPNLEALSQALQVYCMWKKSVPADLQELVSSKYMASLPPLPADKKYVINAGNLTVGIGN